MQNIWGHRDKICCSLTSTSTKGHIAENLGPLGQILEQADFHFSKGHIAENLQTLEQNLEQADLHLYKGHIAENMVTLGQNLEQADFHLYKGHIAENSWILGKSLEQAGSYQQFLLVILISYSYKLSLSAANVVISYY